MNERQPLENPQQYASTQQTKQQLKSKGIKDSRQYEMIECSTQVDDNDEFFLEKSANNSKKNKKKEYKKRKKQRKREESAKICLAEMIQKIYAGKTSFQEEKNNIEVCLWHLVGGNKFHDFLNQTIRFHINTIQKQIQDFVCHLMRTQLRENSQECLEFYLQMVEKIYIQYLDLKQSSGDIERIINLYMKMTSGTEFQETHQLDKSTFRFLIETNQKIKNIIEMCTYKISSKHENEFLHLKEIYEILNKQDESEQYYEESEQYAMERSTEVDEDEDEQRQKILKSKRKKKKMKESEFKSDFEEVVKRLNNMIILDKQRSNCNTSTRWLCSLREKVKKEN